MAPSRLGVPPPATPKTQAPAAFGLMPVLTRSMSALVVPVPVNWSPPGTVAESGMLIPVSRTATRSLRLVVAGVSSASYSALATAVISGAL